MATNALETVDSQSFGGVSRVTNAKRLWVPPSHISILAVTGTWVNEANSNVASLATDDVGGDGELIMIPCPLTASDHISRGSSTVDKGIRIIGLEVFYQVAVSALTDIDWFLYHTVFSAVGAGTATAITKTDTYDTAGDTGVEIDTHRVEILINARDRFFLTSGDVIHAVMDMQDGTASDVNIFGAYWHYEQHFE